MEINRKALDEILSGRSPYLEKNSDEDVWLLLGNFNQAADEVLERLVAGMQNLTGFELGIHQLSPRAAKVLLGMSVDYLFLTGLRNLDEQAAFLLGAWPFDARPIRDLWLEEPISERAAAWLVGEPPPENDCDTFLSVSVPSITLSVAQALSRHTDELFLTVREEMLSPDIAEVLSGHVGYRLTLDCDCGFSDETLRALSGNPDKRTRKEGKRVYVVDHDFWTTTYEDDRDLCESH